MFYYIFIHEISSILVFSIVIIYQIPNINVNFKFQKSGMAFFIVGFLLFLITMTFISLLMYGIFSKFYMYKEKAVKILRAIILFLIIGLVFNIYLNSKGDF